YESRVAGRIVARGMPKGYTLGSRVPVEQQRNRILLVEDEAIIALAQSRSLQSSGYDVVHALTGEAAVETVRTDDRIDLVIMDIDLGSGIDGAEAARRILEIRSLPIVFLSSHGERAVVERVKQITNYGYVVKQSSDFVLLETIESSLKLFAATRAAQERERSFQALFSSIRDAIVVTNSHRAIVEVNPAFTEIFGYQPAEVYGCKTRLLFASDEEYQRLGAALRDLDDVRGFLLQLRYRRRDGSEFTGEKSVQYLIDDHGRQSGLIGLIREIPDRNREI
ncbi:MAG: PAS domain S-box protein, partial [Spirochaetaceae bacterium]